MYTEVRTMDEAFAVAREYLHMGYVATIAELPNGDYSVMGVKK